MFLIAALIIGAGKGGLASAGAVAVPMLSIWMDPLYAAGVLLPVLLASDAVGVWLYRKEFSKRNILLLIPAGLLGVIIATLIVPFVSTDSVTLVTGLIGLVYCIQFYVKRLRKTDFAIPFDFRRGIFWGAMTGITSFISHTGAPPYQTFVLPQKLPKLVYAGTNTIVFTAINVFKIPAYASLGLITDLHWPSIALMIGVACIGAVLGRKLVQWISQEVYNQFLVFTLLGLSVYLLAKSLPMLI